jgi:acid phosphatase (class A)
MAAPAPALPPGFVAGYLNADALRSVSRVPPPPIEAGPDRAAYEATRALRGSPRWTLAAADVPLDAGAAGRVFACALGRPLPAEAAAVLERVKTDAGVATDPAKRLYARKRPFAGEAQPRTCTVMTEREATRSYPSGHAAIGWAWALVLAELAPERADAILARGRAFGESRTVCGVHYLSDVAAGRDVAAATVARLHAEPQFRADMERARAALARTPAVPPTTACEAESKLVLDPLQRAAG